MNLAKHLDAVLSGLDYIRGGVSLIGLDSKSLKPAFKAGESYLFQVMFRVRALKPDLSKVGTSELRPLVAKDDITINV